MNVKINVADIKLETQRLILRPWFKSDLNDFYEYACVEGVGEMAGWKHHDSIEVSKEILQSFIKDMNVFAIVFKENNKVIGSLGLHNSWAEYEQQYKETKLVEIGYVISKDYWGKGLMPEAVREVIRFCFDTCGLDAITVKHASTNHQSKRVIEKCGFRFVKQSDRNTEYPKKGLADMKYIIYC